MQQFNIYNKMIYLNEERDRVQRTNYNLVECI